MDGLAALLLTLVANFGPNGGWVLLPHLDPPEVRRRLPVEAFLDLAPRLWVVHHEVRDQMMAFYSPAEGEEGSEVTVAAWRLVSADSRTERLLPDLRVPRIFLYAPYYRPEGRPLSALEMPLDVAQYFFSALIEASLDLAPPPGLGERAEEYGRGIPAAERRGAYVSALSQFGSDLLSAAGELRRSLARLRAAGKDPCRAVDFPGTLFAHWDRMFTSVEYRGLYRPAGAPPGTWTLGPPLAPADKAFLLDDLLGGFWAGDVRRDFELDCPLADRPQDAGRTLATGC